MGAILPVPGRPRPDLRQHCRARLGAAAPLDPSGNRGYYLDTLIWLSL